MTRYNFYTKYTGMYKTKPECVPRRSCNMAQGRMKLCKEFPIYPKSCVFPIIAIWANNVYLGKVVFISANM